MNRKKNMMELPFSSFEIIQHIDREPGILVAFAAFHPIALLLISLLPLWILKKQESILQKKPMEFLGFLSQLLL